ncbi:MAG: hypothetical protein ACJ797_24215 [Ktedonobacteraceae bacterium]
MKRNDAREFCILYLEPGDDRDALFCAIAGQRKPVVLMLAEESRLFQRSEEFVALKNLKRQLNVAIFFVIASGERLASLAERNGFPVYKSMDALGDALMMEYPAPQGILPRASGEPTSALYHAPRNTVPLTPLEEIVAHMETMPLPTVSPSLQPIRSSTPRPIASQVTQPTMSAMPQPTVLPAPQPAVPAPQPKRGYSRLPAVLIVLMILALSGAGLGSLLVLFHPPPVSMQPAVPPPIVGHVYFLNSGQISENTNKGMDDEVQVDLSNLANRAPGKSYYAWLLGDKNQGETTAVFLGMLAVKNGDAHLFYAGDQSHTNLLAFTSRFLVTEEDSSVIPVAPSPDYGTWRYYGELLQTPLQTPDSMSAVGGMTRLSFLDHLRYLLASDPMLDQNELPGGLNNWFSHNAEKVIELTSSMRESWQESKDMSLIRRQTVQTLAYLDGLSYVSQDLLPNTPLNINARLARIGLIEMNGPNQDPPCYLDSVVFHLSALIQTGGSKTTLRKDATEIIAALNNVRYWLGQVRKDAQQIVKMTDEQLLQPSTLVLINSMIENASNAYAGHIDPTRGEMREGVNWIHDYIQTLAAFEVTAYRVGHSPVQMIPDTRPSGVAWYKYEGES